MKTSSLVLCLTAAVAIAISSCSSGLGNDPRRRRQPEATPTTGNGNLPLGLDIGVTPTDPVAQAVLAGVVVPGIAGGAARDVVLLAFTTAADAADGDGDGTPLGRDAVTDGNGAQDVFVAAICAQDVETRAFSQSLAGKFRHPRCTTCHSLQAADTLAFASATATGEPHQGPLPGPTFPNNQPDMCADCHGAGLFPVPGWQAPAASFDLRHKTVAELADAANRVPADETEHFVSDPRVLWALDSGRLPQNGGRNGFADDDHDGVDEPEDRDGTARTVPGGSAAFIAEIEAWRESGQVVTTADAVKDVTLVSRAFNGAGATAAGNGASSAPQVLWVANTGFDPSSASSAAATNPIGTLYVVYQSDATDLLSTVDGNSVTDVFVTAVELRAEEDANGGGLVNGLNLRVRNDAVVPTVLCSAVSGTSTPGNGPSTQPVIGGTTTRYVAFTSTATNLGDGSVSGLANVYVRKLSNNDTWLLSHTIGNDAIGGNGASSNPAIDASGLAVAFESDASDLIASDTNGLRDVFHTRIDSGPSFVLARASVSATGAEATGGASRNAAIHVSGTGRVRVAFESDASDLASGLVVAPNVFLFDSQSGTTTLLNQSITADGTTIGDGPARNPVIDRAGTLVAFESDAGNIDVLRTDANKVSDVFLVELGQLEAGRVLPYRISLTTATVSDGNGASGSPSFGTFSTTSENFGVGFAAYTTAATNLGTSDSTNVMVAFLAEALGVLAAFSVDAASGVAPLTVQFTDQSTGTPTSWAWDFDNDGNVDSTLQSPNYTYATPGLYTVKLVAANAVSSGDITKTDLLRVIGPVTPDFSATPTSGPGSIATPLSVAFTDLSTEFLGTITAWQWDFQDDGSVDSTVQNPTFNYTVPGSYDVRLTVTGEGGSQTITKSDFVTVYEPVVADFTRTGNSGLIPLLVSFTNTSMGATSYQWDFNEDAIIDSTATNPTFNYTSGGTFDVTLIATGPGGTDTFTFVNCVEAFASVTASFTLSQDSQYTDQSLTLNASGSSGPITAYDWDFDGDLDYNDASGVSVIVNPVGSVFPTTSQTSYTIRLRVTGSGADTATDLQSFIAVAPSENITLDAEQDTTIYENVSANGNGNGAGPALVAGGAATSLLRRSLLQFDVDGNVPAGATINSASLTLRHIAPGGAVFVPTGTWTFELRRLLQSWTEGTTVTNLPAPVGAPANPPYPGTGATATGGDATWIDRTSPGTTWGTAGGSFSGSSSATAQVTNTYTDIVFTLTPSEVEDMLDVPANNHGWVLLGDEDEGTLVRTIKWFASSEHLTSSIRPKLAINYTRALP